MPAYLTHSDSQTMPGKASEFIVSDDRNFDLKKALKLAGGKDSLRFSMFLASFSGGFRALVTLLTSITGQDIPSNSLFAAGISSIALLIDESSRRQTIALYLFARSLDAVIKMCVRDGILPQLNWFYSFVFGVVNIPIQYGFIFMPEILQRGYYKWILNMGAIPEIGIFRTLRERRSLYFDSGIKIPHRLCSEGGLHHDSCLWNSCSDWIFGVARAGKIYLPVHLISLAVFRHKALFNTPGDQLKRITLALVNSCLFLSTYTFIVKGTVCSLRNLRKRDSGWHAIVAGMMTGLSTLFESRSRVSELTLYCIPKGLEAAWTYMKMHGAVKSIPNFEAVFFSFAMAILCSARKRVFRETHFKALCFVLGS